MSVVKNRDFMKLWIGQTVSAVGSRITREGLPMGAVLMMGVTPFTMSGLSLATQLPASVCGLFIGVWVDRVRRRPLMMWADLGRAMLLLTIPLAAMAGWLQLWMFFAVAAATGILSLLFDVSYQAYLPWLVDRRNLVDANTKLGITESAAEVIGPGLTGLLVQVLTAPIAIVFDSLSYVFSAIAVWRVRVKEPVSAPDDALRTDGIDHLDRNWRAEMAEGFSILTRNRVLLTLVTVSALSGFASSPLFLLDTLYALKNLGLTAFEFGATVTMGGVGALLGAALCQWACRRFGVGQTMIATLMLRGLAASAWSFAGGPVWRTMAFLLAWQLFGDACGTMYGILDTTLRQSLVSDALLGRVNSVVRVSQIGLTAMGSLVAGVLGETIGIRATMAWSAVAMVLIGVGLLVSSIRRVHDMPHPDTNGPQG